MSEQYPGGLITKTPVTPSGPYETSTASGVWTLSQQSYWNKLGLWPTAGNSAAVVDPYFEYVTSLLHGDGTNGAQNNTFVDSSTNAYTITRSGSYTGQGSWSPFGTLFSNYFDGTTDYLSLPSGSASALTANSNFTFECWVFLTGYAGTYNGIFGGGSGDISLAYSSNSSWGIYVALVGGAPFIQTGMTPLNAIFNTWAHIAVTRSGNNWTIWVNGVSQATATQSSTSIPNTQKSIAGEGSAGANIMKGFVSNARYTSAALYTTTFTPSTVPLTTTVSSGTVQLLTCQSNRFVDNSTNAYALTPYGDTSVQRFSPFNPTSAYSTATIGGTGYFAQSSYLYSGTTSGYDWGTGNGTMECWFYAATQSTNYPGLVSASNYNTTGACALRWDNIYYKGEAWLYINGGGDPILSSGQIAKNAWHHVAIVRSGSTVTMYVDGVSKSTATWSGAMLWSNGEFRIGRGFDVDGANAYYTGYISNVRNVKGTAVYTGSTYTVPTAPLTAISGTQFLCNTSNAGVVDNAMMTSYDTVGSVQVSTTTFKYGTGSLYFPGSSYLLETNKTLGQFGTGDFTIEYWFNSPATGTGTSYLPQVGTLDSSGTAVGSWRFGTKLGSSSGGIYFAYNTGSFTDITFTTTSPNDGTWHHLACTRQSGTVRAFLDGVQVGSSYTITADFDAHNLVVGAELYSPTYYIGYIDDLRLTKGYARYTANFTPPTTAFPNQ